MEPQVPEGYKVRYKHVRRSKGFTSRHTFGDVVQFQIDPLGGATIATLYKDEPADDDTDSVVQVSYASGVARCHDRDNFNKKIGRRIALGRAVKNLNAINKQPNF